MSDLAADLYQTFVDFGLWAGSQEQRDLVSNSFVGRLSPRDVEMLWLEARDHVQARSPAAMVQKWIEEDRFRAILIDRDDRCRGQRARGIETAPPPDDDTRSRFNRERIQDERFATFRRMHPEFADESDARAAFRDRDIAMMHRDRGVAYTCERWGLTERELKQALERWRKAQELQPLPGNVRFRDLIPKRVTSGA